MSNILTDINPISFSNDLKTWILTFNAVVNELKTTDFALLENSVTIEDNQTIDGQKTFSLHTIFDDGILVKDDSTFQGANTLISSTNFTVRSGITGYVNFIGTNGIRLASNETAEGFSFSFVNPSQKQLLNIDHELEDSIVNIAPNVTLAIAQGQSTAKVKIGNSTWNLPCEDPLTSSLLFWSGGNLSWLDSADFADTIAPAVASSIDSAGLSFASEVFPVGTFITVDTTKAETWTGGLADGHIPDPEFYGWLICNGATITDANPDFVDIIKIIANNTLATSATLPNTTSGSPASVQFVKYLPDPVSSFSLSKGNGIEFFDDATVRTTINLKNGGGRIELKVDTNVFEFDSGSLKLKSNVPLYNSGKLTSATPVGDTDVANKQYVDDRVQAGGVEGSTIDLMLPADGLAYSDSVDNISLIDKSGSGRTWSSALTFGVTAAVDVAVNAISPFGSNYKSTVELKNTFATPDQFFFIDNNDVAYAYGDNSRGEIGSSERGTTISGVNDYQDYYQRLFPSNPYSSSIRQLAPAFLPQRSVWKANAVLVDTVSGALSSSDSVSNLTIKTKDGYGNAYIGDSPSAGLVSYFNGDQPYTRGYYLSVGSNTSGQFGRGNALNNTALAGPSVWGPVGGPGRALWYNFALTDTQKESIKTSDVFAGSAAAQITKRFHWFKPNAVSAGGLGVDETAAVAEWRTQTGLLTESFSDYDWYIKKVVRTFDAHYVIVGKPGDESQNEVWCSGVNRNGAFGIDNASSRVSTTGFNDFQPLLGPSTSISAGTFRSLTGGIFRREDSAPHGLLDFDTMVISGTRYYVVLGETTGVNRSTRFRLFSSFANAVAATRGNTNTGAYSPSAGLINVASTRLTRLKGVVDIIVSRGNGGITGDAMILRRATGFTTIPSGLLDRVPEANITSVEILACGHNLNGRLAQGGATILTNITLPTLTNFALSPEGKITKIVMANSVSACFALDTGGNLYFAGNRATGMADVDNIAGNTVSWTRVNLSSSHDIIDYNVIDDGSLSRIFVIGSVLGSLTPKYELFAGGLNTGFVLGTSVNLNAATSRYARIVFPENPQNITRVCGAMQQTYILCKNQGEDIGRVYVAGSELSRSYMPTGTSVKTIPQFKNIDRFIL